MSEEILKALVQLLAIIATEDEITVDEKATIENFLSENLAKNKVAGYLQLFDSISGEIAARQNKEDDLNKIKGIASKMNSELTNKQKTVVMLNLISLIVADGKITDRENEYLYAVGQQTNISQKVIDYIKAFTVYTDRNKLISSNVLVIDDGSGESVSKAKHLKREGLNGFLFFLRIPTIDTYFLKYVGEDASMTLNGNHMRTGKIYVYSRGSTIRSESMIMPVYYSDVVNIFQSEHHDSKLSLVANNVSFQFKNGNIGLREINISESSGKLIGLMGASGSGKSTLLNVLNGNEKPSSGSVQINGIDIHQQKDKVEGVIGYVPQDDLLMEDLTVFDNLYYAAKLCFKQLKNEELVELVNKTLDALGLLDTSSLKVGSPLEKTISGGQRKRLNIGLELLREPSVLFIDEPTSGLSSRDSENIMDLLRDLSLKGKMIFVVIHQPSIDIFKMFDKLIILDVGGYQIYYGNPIDGIRYFKNVVNLVDSSASLNPEQIFNIVEAKVVNEYGYFTKQRKISPEQWHEEFKNNITLPTVEVADEDPPKNLNIPNKLKQTAIFCKRDVLSKLSNRQYLIINLLEAPLLALLLAFIVRYVRADRSSYVFQENENLPVFFFMSIIVALFMGLTVSAEEIVKDRKILKRESFLNLSRSSYILSKLVILFSISAVQTVTFVIIGCLILEIPGITLVFWVVMFSASCFANVLGLNISASFRNVITIYILIPLLIIPQLLLSGVVVNFDKLNPVLSSENKVPLVGEIMASRWAFEALAVAQFKENPFEKQFYEFDQVAANSEFKTVYLLPSLLSKLENCKVNLKSSDPEVIQRVDNDFLTIKNEFSKMLSDPENIQSLKELNRNDFKESTFEDLQTKIRSIKTYFNKQSKAAISERDKITNALKKEFGDRHLLEEKKKYVNDRLSLIVKNTQTNHRVLEKDNHLIQKLYPIFLIPETGNPLDFRAQFYQPYKQIFGMLVPTQWFNVIIIWLMTIILIVTLYFDVLRKILSGKKPF